MSRPRRPFWDFVDRTGFCWEWQGIRNRDGYGFMVRQEPGERRRTIMAHRYAYELEVGPIPDGYQIDHLCRNEPCVRPDHLEAVPPVVNVYRSLGPAAMNARKTHCPAGHPLVQKGTANRRHCPDCDRTQDAARRRIARRHRLGLPDDATEHTVRSRAARLWPRNAA